MQFDLFRTQQAVKQFVTALTDLRANARKRDVKAKLIECLLPGLRMLIDRVEQCSIYVENNRFKHRNIDAIPIPTSKEGLKAGAGGVPRFGLLELVAHADIEAHYSLTGIFVVDLLLLSESFRRDQEVRYGVVDDEKVAASCCRTRSPNGVSV